MKVSVPKSYGNDDKQTKPILPLVPTKGKSKTKENSLTFELKTAGGANATKYKFSCLFLHGDEELRDALNFQENFAKVVKGLELENKPEQAQEIARQLLKDSAQAHFDLTLGNAQKKEHERLRQETYQVAIDGGRTPAQAKTASDAIALPAINMDMINEGIKGVIAFMMPCKALERIKRYLRHHCRKPADMKFRVFATHFLHVNYNELLRIPPAKPGQCLSEDEILDIWMFAIPNSWNKQMTCLNYDPFAHDLDSFIEFCERMEEAEGFNPDGAVTKKSSSSSTKKSKSSSGKHCMLHGNGNHSTDECKTLQRQVGKMSGQSGGSSNSNSNGNYKNKTWSRSAAEAKKKTGKEIAAFIKKAVRKELHAVSAKRKAAEVESKDDDLSINAMDIDLSAFNYGSDVDDNVSVNIALSDDESDRKPAAKDDSSVDTTYHTADEEESSD